MTVIRRKRMTMKAAKAAVAATPGQARANLIASLKPEELSEPLVAAWAKLQGLAIGRPAQPAPPPPKEIQVGEFLIAVEQPKYPAGWAAPEVQPPEDLAVILGRVLERNEALRALDRKMFIRIDADSQAKNRGRLRLFVLEKVGAYFRVNRLVLLVLLAGCASEPTPLPRVVAGARWADWSTVVAGGDTLWSITARTHDGDLTVQFDNECADSIRVSQEPVYCIEAWRFDSSAPDGKEWDGPPEDMQAMIWQWAKGRRPDGRVR